MNNLPNIKYKKPGKNPTIDAETSLYVIPFYKDAEYFANLDNFIAFVKATEQMIRTSKFYARYIKYIKEDIGLNFCQVMSNIKQEEEGENVKIEMHHGPILTLFDYVSIVTDYLLYHNKKITTYTVADIVLEEHFNNNVQIVMLSETAHELVHDGDVFINYKQGFGNLEAFLKKYRDGISDDQISKINKYIELSEKYDSFDKHVLDLRQNVKKWTDN